MKRRTFLQGLGAATASAALGGTQVTAATQRPNIIVIMADDMGYSDIGCYGSEISTPNIDSLADNGVRFTQYYNAARCCPTRASLLTGLYPHQAGMGGMISRGYNKPAGPYQGYLNDQCVTIPEVLRNAGYSTYCSGKWHVGEEPEHWPRERGFDRYFGLISGASSYYELVVSGRQMVLDDEPWRIPDRDFYMTDAFTDHAVQCIDEHDEGRPFFQYLPYTAPHFPLHALPEDIEKYRDRYREGWDVLREERHARMKELGVIDSDWALSPRDPDVPAWEDRDRSVDWELRMAVYAAMIDRMDQGIGRVMDALRRRNMLDNTLIMFVADNGGCHESVSGRGLNTPGSKPGERGSYVGYLKPWANASNTPFRLFKQYIHEGGISSPLVAHWPKGIEARGEITNSMHHVMDFMPTCCELANATYPDTYRNQPIQPMEGESLLPALHGEAQSEPRTLYWEHMRNTAVRSGDWKLVSRRENTEWELFDMVTDRTELTDRSADSPNVKEKLLGQYNDWATRVGV